MVKDGALYITNEQSNDLDMIDDIIHEVAHLVYLNHSKDFWNTVGSLDANYQESKNWLRINGDFLQRVG